jgi:large subunit ribosomal protein L29
MATRKKSAVVREMDDPGLLQALADAKEELFNLRFQMATNQLDNTARIRAVRREAARIATIMREQEIEAYYRMEEQGDD